MGVIIDVRDHSLGVENSRIRLLKNHVNVDINHINQDINALSNYWKDDKSESTISELNTMLDDVKKANLEAERATEEYLQAIGQILKMSYGGN